MVEKLFGLSKNYLRITTQRLDGTNLWQECSLIFCLMRVVIASKRVALFGLFFTAHFTFIFLKSVSSFLCFFFFWFIHSKD